MQAERTFNISTLIEEQKTGRFAVGLLFWCFLIMLMDGYDQTAVSFAAPAIIKEWHVARGGFGPVLRRGSVRHVDRRRSSSAISATALAASVRLCRAACSSVC